MNRPARLLIAVLALALLACGNTQDPGAEADTEFNDADIEFASGMIPHHAQALAMVDLTTGRTLDPEVTKLAERIRDAQAPEIEQMTDWLAQWRKLDPDASGEHAGHGEMADMPGMMTADEMAALAGAADSEFQTVWLEMMVRHHEGAVEMARTQQEDGEYADALVLARAIETGQTEEIELIRGLLNEG
jgi:uncharacterized protein (DUF305 family)